MKLMLMFVVKNKIGSALFAHDHIDDAQEVADLNRRCHVEEATLLCDGGKAFRVAKAKEAKKWPPGRLVWYVKQLLPLRYETEYLEGSQEKHCVWRMWFGRCFWIHTTILTPAQAL